MTYYAGKDMLLKTGTWSGGTAVAGFTTNTISINNQTIDVSNKDSRFRQLIAGGVHSLTISGSGVASDSASWETFKGYATTVPTAANALAIGTEDGDTIEASFIITSFTITGSHTEGQTFDFTAESAGTVTYTAA